MVEMLSLIVRTLHPKRIWLALVLLALQLVTAFAQFDGNPKTEPESAQSKKVFAALELAKMAALANQPDVSFEAMIRVA